jgi:hypothetical protein
MDTRLRRRLTSKRKRIYAAFIKDRRSKEPLLKKGEKHHIRPRSLGGSDERANLIKLTRREHLFAHYLLAHIYGGAMWFALWLMLKCPRYNVPHPSSTHRWYALARERCAECNFIKARVRNEALCRERAQVLKKIGMPRRQRPSGNPRVPGTFGYRSMEIILNEPGISWEEFRSKGGRTADLHVDIFKGHVRLDANKRIWPSVA